MGFTGIFLMYNRNMPCHGTRSVKLRKRISCLMKTLQPTLFSELENTYTVPSEKEAPCTNLAINGRGKTDVGQSIDGSKLNKVKWAADFRNINHPSFYRGQKREVPSNQNVVSGISGLKTFLLGV